MFVLLATISYFMGNFAKELPTLIYVCIATIINQAMLIYGVNILLKRNSSTPVTEFERLCGVLVWPLKILILGHAFYMGVQMVGDRIVISLIFYIVQIAILLVNINKFENNGYQPV